MLKEKIPSAAMCHEEKNPQKSLPLALARLF